ncbi:uncharacterized protein LOC136034551 [Artemia franciscana]|uniref:Protein snakeskin n=1 Tax=Artemia franciscana TaxID=6661 RepID=A0AA88I2K3_ARTSF|nr:hypothetical protein QYM36_003087 [Artemia franciscana]
MIMGLPAMASVITRLTRTGKEEEKEAATAKVNSEMADLRVFARVLGFLKLAEVLVSIICLALLRNYGLSFGGEYAADESGKLISGGSFADRYLTGTITLGGFLIISLGLLISYIWGEAGTYQRFLELLYNFVAMIMFFVSGALVLQYYTSDYIYPIHQAYAGVGKTFGALLLVNGVLYLLDFVTAYRTEYNAA